MSPLLLLPALFLITGGCQSPSQPEKPSALEWTSLEKRIILNLKSLEGTPGTETFFRDLAAAPGLREALDKGAGPDDKRRFHDMVARHEKDGAFLKAVEDPSPEAAPPPCGDPEAERNKVPLLLPKPPQDSPFGAPPGCAAKESPVEPADIFLPPTGAKTLK